MFGGAEPEKPGGSAGVGGNPTQESGTTQNSRTPANSNPTSKQRR